MKFHFMASILFATFAVLMAIEEKSSTRLMMLVFLLALYYLSLILFSYDYDRQSLGTWKRKEKKLIEETYTKFFQKSQKKII